MANPNIINKAISLTDIPQADEIKKGEIIICDTKGNESIWIKNDNGEIQCTGHQLTATTGNSTTMVMHQSGITSYINSINAKISTIEDNINNISLTDIQTDIANLKNDIATIQTLLQNQNNV